MLYVFYDLASGFQPSPTFLSTGPFDVQPVSWFFLAKNTASRKQRRFNCQRPRILRSKKRNKTLNLEQNFTGWHICIEIKNKILLKMTKLLNSEKKLYDLTHLWWNSEHNSSINGTKFLNSEQNSISWHICIEIRNKTLLEMEKKIKVRHICIEIRTKR